MMIQWLMLCGEMVAVYCENQTKLRKSPRAPSTSSPQQQIVWCGIASFGVLGPYFFEDNEGTAVTVTSKRYVEMLRNFCEVHPSSVWFQQDGARARRVFCEKCFHNKSFLVAVMFYGLRFHLISPPLITFYGLSQ
jgi:hypothetical protein